VDVELVALFLHSGPRQNIRELAWLPAPRDSVAAPYQNFITFLPGNCYFCVFWLLTNR
jgi:hypothetical protein